MKTFQIRNIQPADDPTLALIIRNALAEFGANRPGTVYDDPATDHLSALYNGHRSIYYVAFLEEVLIGGAGIGPLEGSGENICELQKMYLAPEARGQGIGRHLIERCLQFAQAAGYAQCYLETMPELKKALSVYEKFGFRYLDVPMGNTGHHGCNIWMIKDLQ